MDVQILCNAILFMLTLLVINEVLTNYWMNNRYLKNYLNNTIITALIGIAAGLFLLFIDKSSLLQEYRQGFSQFFLIVLLPPILFESSINMEKALFFQNFGSIVMFAVIGTLIATFVTAFSLQLVGLLIQKLSLTSSYAFGSLISSTDPVAVLAIFKQLDADKHIHILLYGESILNDAISLLLYEISGRMWNQEVVGYGEAMKQFLTMFIVSIAIGIIIGVLCAYILKVKEEVSYETEHIEVSVTVIIPWVCYLISQAVGYSGIVSIVFCGIVMAKYALPNLSESGKELLNKFYHILSYNFENLVFLFIGIGVVGYDLAWNEMGIVLAISSILIVIVARFINIKIVSFILNRYRHDNFIKPNHQKAMWFCGLRGAMAYALALDAADTFKEEGEIILTMTVVIIALNIFVQGSALQYVLEKCDIQEKPKEISSEINVKDFQSENGIRIAHQKGWVHRMKDCLEKCDEKVFQEFLVKKRELTPVRQAESH
ncbi:unnamed protein product [Paramecium primaurelia]|uniref:Sodium/hydrogen exchanger n=1 Tax=Paramecium primaurelia TaxID=5886 RepID=A0A8S1P537_PARPR|nr:unnamed protein product [Paramecium primaurelia]